MHSLIGSGSLLSGGSAELAYVKVSINHADRMPLGR